MLVAAALLFGSPAVAPAVDLELAVATDYSVGDYGGDDDIHIVYTPVVASFETEVWTFRFTLPFLHVEGGNATIDTPGGPVRAIAGTTDGLGDIVLEGRRWFSPLFDGAPYVQVGTRLKLPTGDADEGLGTGEVDVHPEILFARVYGRWTPYASLGYRVLGDRPVATYLDGFTAGLGATWQATERFEPGLFAYWREAASAGSDDSAEILPTLRVRLLEDVWLDLYATVGLTDSSADAGGGLQLRWRLRDAIASRPRDPRQVSR